MFSKTKLFFCKDLKKKNYRMKIHVKNVEAFVRLILLVSHSPTEHPSPRTDPGVETHSACF